MFAQNLTDQDGRLPLYQRLRDDLSAKIAGQFWRPGEALPSEQVLASQYGVASGTIRKAIESLVQEGQLERRQGSGTFVRRPDFRSSLARFFRYASTESGHAMPEGRVQELHLVTPEPMVAQKLALPDKARAVFLDRLRLLDGAPLLAEEIWLPEDRFASLLEIPPTGFGDLLYPLYERHCGQVIARAHERLTAEPATTLVAGKLEIPVGSAVIVIERLAFGYDDTPLEWRRSRGPAARFEYEAEIR